MVCYEGGSTHIGPSEPPQNRLKTYKKMSTAFNSLLKKMSTSKFGFNHTDGIFINLGLFTQRSKLGAHRNVLDEVKPPKVGIVLK